MVEIISGVGYCDNQTITKTSLSEMGSHLEVNFLDIYIGYNPKLIFLFVFLIVFLNNNHIFF